MVPCPCIRHRNRTQRMYVGSENEVKVWLNGTLIYENASVIGGVTITTRFFPCHTSAGEKHPISSGGHPF